MSDLMAAVHFSRVFAAAHRVWNDDSKCQNIHGHNFRVELDIATDALTDQGFVVPFEAVKVVIDRFDHALILDVADPLLDEWADSPVRGELNVQQVAGVPSAEFMADLLAREIANAVLEGSNRARNVTVSLRLRETDGFEASATVTRLSAAERAAERERGRLRVGLKT